MNPWFDTTRIPQNLLDVCIVFCNAVIGTVLYFIDVNTGTLLLKFIHEVLQDLAWLGAILVAIKTLFNIQKFSDIPPIKFLIKIYNAIKNFKL